jgi:glutamate/tyrosine decarboxylase-like PLP-dependent enzyme
MGKTGNVVKTQSSTPVEAERLDPENWEDFAVFCRERLDYVLGHLASTGDNKVWSPVPESVKEALSEKAPVASQGIERACGDVEKYILPHLLGNTHPRFFGWVHGTGTAGGVMSAIYAAAINANLGGREHAPVYVERAVISWFLELFGFPSTASGILLSGTSMANLVALTVARNLHSPVDVRKKGVAALPKGMVGYTSAESHHSNSKAFELLGLGSEQLRKVPTNDDLTMDTAALREQIATDRASGAHPFCVIGTAGTVNSGAIDDLTALAEICREEDLWFHVDGAFGAMAILSDEFESALSGIENADSLAFDFHKWLHVQYDAGCVLIRNREAHLNTFNTSTAYLQQGEAASAGAPWFCELGPELSRGFRALHAWFAIKEHGLEKFGRNVTRNCHQARYLRDLVDTHANLELVAPVSLNIVCFRYRVQAMTADELNEMNRILVLKIQQSGIAVVSQTTINNTLAIRVNITNHRTESADLRLLVSTIDELAPAALSEIGDAANQPNDFLQPGAAKVAAN